MSAMRTIKVTGKGKSRVTPDRDCQVKCVSIFNLSRMEYFSTRDFWL